MASNKTKLRPICKLDQSVINKICAGEIIHRPLNVIKELIENSLDAGSSVISVSLKNGGLKKIIIQDNGCGIRKEDLAIACKRFTTSKLEQFEDFKSLNTFGFRGEALASISTVSQLTITTKTSDSVCGYKAEFIDGELKASTSITSVASNNGTNIVVDNLFYNMPIRRAALSSESYEFGLVQELIIKYSILLSQKCSFTLNKLPDVTPSIATNLSNSVLNNINNLYGQNISSCLVPFNLENVQLGFKAEGFCSNNDLNLKKMHFLLFINSRLVESTLLKRSIKEVYKNFLMKSGNPFILLILHIEPMNIDVNIHPTKSEVCFLHSNEIIDEIVNCVTDRLRNIETKELCSKNTKDRNLLSSTLNFPLLKKDTSLSNNSISESCSSGNQNRENRIKVCNTVKPSKQIRIDSKDQRIDQYLNRKSNTKNRRDLQFTSLLQLRRELLKTLDNDLLEIITKSSYIGCIDQNYALIQNELNLVLVKIGNLNQELFYQIILLDFGNFDYIKFKTPLPIYELLSAYFKSNPSQTANENVDQKIKKMTNLLISKSAMLNDYFSIKINSESRAIEAIPILVANHLPPLSYMPKFIYAIIANVDWNDEKKCFHTTSLEIANFYCNTPVNFKTESEYHTWSNLVETGFYPLYRSLLYPSFKLKSNKSFHCLTNITSLYKVFERC